MRGFCVLVNICLCPYIILDIIKCNILVIGIPVYATSLLAAALVSGSFQAIIMPIVCILLKLASYVISLHKLVTKIGSAKRKNRIHKRYSHICQSIWPVRLKYGSFGTRENEFCNGYCWILILRIYI